MIDIHTRKKLLEIDKKQIFKSQQKGRRRACTRCTEEQRHMVDDPVNSPAVRKAPPEAPLPRPCKWLAPSGPGIRDGGPAYADIGNENRSSTLGSRPSTTDRIKKCKWTPNPRLRISAIKENRCSQLSSAAFFIMHKRYKTMVNKVNGNIGE